MLHQSRARRPWLATPSTRPKASIMLSVKRRFLSRATNSPSRIRYAVAGGARSHDAHRLRGVRVVEPGHQDTVWGRSDELLAGRLARCHQHIAGHRAGHPPPVGAGMACRRPSFPCRGLGIVHNIIDHAAINDRDLALGHAFGVERSGDGARIAPIIPDRHLIAHHLPPAHRSHETAALLDCFGAERKHAEKANQVSQSHRFKHRVVPARRKRLGDLAQVALEIASVPGRGSRSPPCQPPAGPHIRCCRRR